jgi:quinoprotein glucose dehydrogenase
MLKKSRGVTIAGVTTMTAIWILCFGTVTQTADGDSRSHTTWSTYLGNPDGSHYSALDQINRSNVDKLQVAWTYDAGTERSYEFNPIVVGRTMYVIAQRTSIVALDAATGRQLWIYRSKDVPLLEMHRGINFWQNHDGSEQRLLIAFNDHLEAIDAHTGARIKSFGTDGRVDLKQGLGRNLNTIRQIQSGTPGQVYGDLIILGSATGEEYGSPPGDIRAFNVRTGHLVWTFHTIPRPGEFGYGSWPKEAWTYSGGTNCWGEMTLDEERGIVYIPLGAPTYDFYGIDRTGNNLFADSLVALNARTGKLIWYYQLIHHDLWDYDATAAPQLLTVVHDGNEVPIVAQATKQGFLYVFNRITGKPIWPIEERPVPQSDVPGEATSPTQPFPTLPPPFARQKFTVDDLDPYLLTPEVRERWRQVVSSASNKGLFTPPGFTDTIEMPGNHGGANWGMTASDPTSGTMLVYSMDLPAILKLEHRLPPFLWEIPMDAAPLQRGQAVYHFYCERCHGVDHEGAPPAIPSLVNAPGTFGVETIKGVVRSGYKEMPGYPDLYDVLLDNLVHYLAQPIPATSTPIPQAATGDTSGASNEPKTLLPIAKRYWSGYGLQPAIISPPWSTLTAYNLNDGMIKWQVSLGDSPAAMLQGVKGAGLMMPRNGPVVTAGGLIFIATRDEGKLHALDEQTGREIWSYEMPASSEGVPAVYEIDGREFLVVCATSAKMKEIPRDGPPPPTAQPLKRMYIAFALPKGAAAKQ